MEVLHNPESSLFEFVNGLDNRRAFPNSHRSLRVISHEIEDSVIDGHIPARFFAGFQRVEFFMREFNRYQQLARVAESVWIFAVQDSQPPPIPNVFYVPLSPTDALAQEWFVIADSSDYFSALSAQDLNNQDVPTSQRRYRGIWTFEPGVVHQADQWLERRTGVVTSDINLAARDYSRQLYQIGRTVENLIKDLEFRNAELLRAQALARTLTEMIVHDINNPLTAILSCLYLIDLALARNKPETIPRHTRAAMERTQQAVGLIKDMLEVSRMEAGEFKLELQRIDFSKIVESVMRGFVTTAELQGKHLKAEIVPPVWVYGDQEILVRVLANLVGNAFKFTLVGGLIAISVSPSPDGQNIVCGVMDDGLGIPRHQQQHIFDKYGQVHGNERHGFGLGLTFCRMSIEAHGGKISVDSDEGIGTIFQFTLRSAPAETDGANV